MAAGPCCPEGSFLHHCRPVRATSRGNRGPERSRDRLKVTEVGRGGHRIAAQTVELWKPDSGLGMKSPLHLEVQGSKVVHSNLKEVEGGPSWRGGQDSQPPAPLAQAAAQGPPPLPPFPMGRLTPCFSGLQHRQSQAKAHWEGISLARALNPEFKNTIKTLVSAVRRVRKVGSL